PEGEHILATRGASGGQICCCVRPKWPKLRIQLGKQGMSVHIEGRAAVPIIVGSGDYKFEIVENWAKLPDGWSFKEVAAVGVDQADNVYVFNRGDHPMMIFD